MDQRYSISSDHADRILEFRVWGIWDAAQAKAFEEEFKRHVERLSTRGRFSVLADKSQFPAQRTEIQEPLRRCMGLAQTRGMVACGTVVRQMDLELQASRFSKGSQLGFFMKRQEAMAWLRELGSEPGPRRHAA